MQKTEEFWDRVAAKYAKSPIKNQAGYEQTLSRTRSFLKESDRVLEIGAGTARTALLLAGQVAEIVATDISDTMLAVGRGEARDQGIENVSFEQCSTEDLPEGPFDVVLAHNILHLVEDLPATLAASHKSLRPGGLMISKTFCKPKRGLHLEYRVMKVILPVMQMLGKAPFVAMMTIEELDAAHRAAGFEIIESGHYPANEARRYIVARKT